MRRWLMGAGLALCGAFVVQAADDEPVDFEEKASMLADEQDELSADVQQLVIEQTVPEVIKLLGEVEDIMDEATDRLAETDTGGETIAAQTEIIEKIYQASKKKQNQGGGGKAGGAMMDMMERMMGKTPNGDKPGKGNQPGGQAGEGMTGESGTGNEAVGGAGGGESGERRVPKASGATPLEIPREFQKAFDAYNRGAEELVK